MAGILSAILSFCQLPSGDKGQSSLTVVGSSCGMSSFTRGRVCCFQLLLDLASTAIFVSDSNWTHKHTLLCQTGNLPRLESHVSVIISSGILWPDYNRRHWVHFSWICNVCFLLPDYTASLSRNTHVFDTLLASIYTFLCWTWVKEVSMCKLCERYACLYVTQYLNIRTEEVFCLLRYNSL
jgi:hypothetical protein